MKRVFRAPIFKHTQETDGVIAMRKTMSLVLVLLTPLFVSATTTTTTSVPVVNSVTVSYSSNEVTVNGSGFSTSKRRAGCAVQQYEASACLRYQHDDRCPFA